MCRVAVVRFTLPLVAEVHGLALGRAGPEIAHRLVERILDSGRVEIVATGPARLRDAVDLLRARPGRRISITDAVSFLVMRRRGLSRAFTLDADFAAEGFEVPPPA